MRDYGPGVVYEALKALNSGAGDDQMVAKGQILIWAQGN